MGYFFDVGKKLFQNACTGAKEVVAKWDPEFATEVEIEQMEEQFDKINAEVTRQALFIAYLDDFKLMMILTFGVLPLLLLMRKSRKPDETPLVATD